MAANLPSVPIKNQTLIPVHMKKYLLSIIFLFTSLLGYNQTVDADLIEQFSNETGAKITIHRATGAPSFIQFSQKSPLKLKGTTLEEKAKHFMVVYNGLFGFRKNIDELSLTDEITDEYGMNHITLHQHYQGVPIYDGLLRFHFNQVDELTAVNGVFIPNINLNTTPNLTPAEAQASAISHVYTQTNTGNIGALNAANNTLHVFRHGLVQGIKAHNYLAYEVEVVGNGVREFVFIDTQKGKIIEQFTGTFDLLDRQLYETSNNPGNLIWSEGDNFPGSLDEWEQNEIEAAGHMYYLFTHTFGYVSYDNADAPMVTVHEDPTIFCPNATWNGTSANYCFGTASDDVVAHEWGHAYTENTSNLVYQWQPGALNESYSDIWGEVVDLYNGYDDAGENPSPRTNCINSQRWKVGEGATSFPGPIRDMWNPNCEGDPGKVSDANYHCGTNDFGGVHSNSGVPNHAFALMVDGGTYNGQTIAALGMTKAAHIHWRAQRFYLTSTSDFSVNAAALETACADLVGMNLEGLTMTNTPVGPSGEVITTADCVEVTKAILAVEMADAPSCGFTPLLSKPAPSLCAAGEAPNVLYIEDFEAGIGSWLVTQEPSNPATWDPREWVWETSLPSSRAGAGLFGPDPIPLGDCATDLDNGIIRLESPTITIPPTETGPFYLSFYHYVATEASWDGGNVKYSRNGSTWQLIPGSSFVFNGYNGTLNTAGQGNDNPLAGQVSFNGSDGGSVTGSWGESQINLNTLNAVPGDNFQFRFELGTDGCNGLDGWYLDDISLFNCAATLPIELIDFTARAKDDNALLEWATAMEINNRGFEIQRSPDENRWESLGFVEGAGNSNDLINYTFIDEAPKYGDNYYRLKQLDLDGQYSYSEVEVVKFTRGIGEGILVYPLPFEDGFSILIPGLYGADEEVVEIELFDVSGKRLFQYSTTAAENVPVELTGLTSFAVGVYYVRVKTKDRMFVERCVKVE